MTETSRERRPRRDADGRLIAIGDLLGVALARLVYGVVVLNYRAGLGGTS